MTTCCGSRCETRFCPKCGKPNYSLSSLLTYLRTQAELLTNRLNSIKKIPAGQTMSPQRERRIKVTTRHVEKWTSWANEVERVVNK